MNVAWDQTGYPQRHDDEVRRADRYALIASGVTGSLFIVLLAAAVFWTAPPLLAAAAGAIFLLFGLLGGLGTSYQTRRYVRLMPYFQRPVGGIDTFLSGTALARSLAQLDAVAAELNITPLSAFGFNDDLRGETPVWHAPQAGLQSVAALLDFLSRQEMVPQGILAELRIWQAALEKAVAAEIPFCLLLMHGNTTSGHEWSVRQGSAF